MPRGWQSRNDGATSDAEAKIRKVASWTCSGHTVHAPDRLSSRLDSKCFDSENAFRSIEYFIKIKGKTLLHWCRCGPPNGAHTSKTL